jgi:N-acetylated-alpha-linked acidic dipeptidase
LAEAWLDSRAGKGFERDLPGSGSDFAVFQHHLGLPVLDLGLHGNGGGQYHTAFDDFAVVDRYLDPGWNGHALAARVLTELLVELSGDPQGGFDAREAAQALERMARSARDEARLSADPAAWEALADAASELAASGPSCSGPEFYRSFEQAAGLQGRTWFKNRLWAPGLESGYGSETWPSVAALAGASERRRELELLARCCAGLSARAGAPER